MALYRIYVDEVGNHDLTQADDPNRRFLSLTGVIQHPSRTLARTPHFRRTESPTQEREHRQKRSALTGALPMA